MTVYEHSVRAKSERKKEKVLTLCHYTCLSAIERTLADLWSLTQY